MQLEKFSGLSAFDSIEILLESLGELSAKNKIICYEL